MLIKQKGDLVNGNYTIFCHQVNCKGRMGSGIAAQIKNKYPEVFNEYKFHCNAGLAELGTNLYVHTHDGRVCVNMFAQDNYGRDGKRYTDYTAFKNCLNSLAEFVHSHHIKVPVAFPYLIGCGLGGGDWYIIQGMIKDFSEKVDVDVYIVSLF